MTERSQSKKGRDNHKTAKRKASKKALPSRKSTKRRASKKSRKKKSTSPRRNVARSAMPLHVTLAKFSISANMKLALLKAIDNRQRLERVILTAVLSGLSKKVKNLSRAKSFMTRKISSLWQLSSNAKQWSKFLGTVENHIEEHLSPGRKLNLDTSPGSAITPALSISSLVSTILNGIAK